MWSIIRGYRAVLGWNYCGVCVYGRTVHTHHRFKITLPNTDPSTRQNICESLPDDGSHKIRNMSEWFLILCLLNFYTTWILTSKFCTIECISRTVKVLNYNNAWWKPEINWNFIYIYICTQALSRAFSLDNRVFIEINVCMSEIFALLWWWWLVVRYRRFGTNYRFHQGSSSLDFLNSLTLEEGTGRLYRNVEPTLRNIPEERRDGSLNLLTSILTQTSSHSSSADILQKILIIVGYS